MSKAAINGTRRNAVRQISSTRPTPHTSTRPETQGVANSTASTVQPQQSPGVQAEHGNALAKEERRSYVHEPFLSGSSDDPPNFEDVQALIGKSGIWQLRIFLLASFSGFCTSMHNLIYGFIGVAPDYQCKLPDIPHAHNYSRKQLMDLLTSRINETDRKCMQHAWSWREVNNSITIETSKTIVACSNFEYDRSEFESTVATEWNLVCEYASWTPYIQVTYMFGLLVGAPVFGAISDRFGRKYAIFIATLIFSITGPLIAFAPNFTVLLLLRFVLACALPGVYACSYVLAIEVISERWRPSAGNYFNLPFATGYTVLPIVAYFVRSWKTLQLICSAPSLLLIFTWYMLPESPRWLIRKKRLAEAEKILRRAAVVNKTEANIPEDFSELIKAIYEQEKELDEENTFWGGVRRGLNDYLNIVKSARMRSLFLTLCFCWCIIGMTYYGLGLNSSNLSTDRYTYVFIVGLLEFPGYLMVPFFIKHFGRKRVFIGFMWTCGFALLVSVFLPKGTMVVILLSYVGKLFIGANYSLVYLYSSELLPTLVRNCALGVCSMMGRLGSTIAPFIVDIVGRDNHMYPSLIFGLLAVLAGALSLILPETQHRRLPETIEEVEMGNGVGGNDDSKNKATAHGVDAEAGITTDANERER